MRPAPGRSDYIEVTESQELWRYARIGELEDLLKGVVRLTCPIRWQADDPYESFMFSNEVIAKDGKKLDAEAEGRKIYVQCWSKVLCERHNMWQLYGDNGRGVIMRTTAERLLWSVYNLFDTSKNEQLISKVGAVLYLQESEIDRVPSDPSTYNQMLEDYHLISRYKRSAYISEEEVRLIVHDLDDRNRKPAPSLSDRIVSGTSKDHLRLNIGASNSKKLLTGIFLGAKLSEREVSDIKSYCHEAGIDPGIIDQSKLYSPKRAYRINFSSK